MHLRCILLLKVALNFHAHKLYNWVKEWVKELWRMQPFKNWTASISYLAVVFLCRYIHDLSIRK